MGNEELRFPTAGTRLTFKQTWVTVENILSNCDSTFEVQKLARSDISVLSIDIDGNDLWLTVELLRSGFLPSVIIIEYKPLLTSPLTWARACSPDNVPRGSDYGASLQYRSDNLAGFGYFLAACALQNGNNAFLSIAAIKIFSLKFPTISCSPTLEGVWAPLNCRLAEKSGNLNR